MGYRFAMDKYRANDIIHEVNLRSTDLWNRYQRMPLPDPSKDPDLSDFPEYAKFTPAGFLIDVTSHPDVAFRMYVYDVPSRVCKQVLNVPLINVIKDLQYIQVNDVKYEDMTQICRENQTDNVMVFTSFLDSENDLGNRNHCLEDSECTSACWVPACNKETMTCTDGCTGNTDGKNICLQSTGRCVECLVNEDCKPKGTGYICAETTHECEKIQKTCPEGTFRTRNGACVSCRDGNNFFVYKNGEAFPDSSDTMDGYEMCQMCDPTRQYGESLEDPEVGYCSYMCTMGVSYQTADGRCVSCADTAAHRIAQESVSQAQCAACPNHIWYCSEYLGCWCSPKPVCQENEYRAYKDAPTGTTIGCVACSRKDHPMLANQWSSSDPGYLNEIFSSCEQCPEYTNGVWSKRVRQGGWCILTCQQPENAEEQIAICQANPSDPNCTRQWQANGSCYPCDYIGVDTSIGNFKKEIKQLCEQCGRRITSDGSRCVPKGISCPLGQYLNKYGTCYKCGTFADIESDELSGCTANCRQNEAGEYTADGTIETTWVDTYNNHNNTYQYCQRKCSSDQFLGSGQCRPCNYNEGDGAVNVPTTMTKQLCVEACPNREIVLNAYCVLKKCPEGMFRGTYGKCWDCNAAPDTNGGHNRYELYNQRDIDECQRCGTRIAVKHWYMHACVSVDPGKTGICNSVDNDISELNADLVRQAQPYLNGNYDGKLFRGYDAGKCHSCDDKQTF